MQKNTKIIRKAVESAGVSYNQLAHRAGIDQSQISRFMRGERDLSLAAADKLCKVLGLELTETKVRKKSV